MSSVHLFGGIGSSDTMPYGDKSRGWPVVILQLNGCNKSGYEML